MQPVEMTAIQSQFLGETSPSTPRKRWGGEREGMRKGEGEGEEGEGERGAKLPLLLLLLLFLLLLAASTDFTVYPVTGSVLSH